MAPSRSGTTSQFCRAAASWSRLIFTMPTIANANPPLCATAADQPATASLAPVDRTSAAASATGPGVDHRKLVLRAALRIPHGPAWGPPIPACAPAAHRRPCLPDPGRLPRKVRRSARTEDLYKPKLRRGFVIADRWRNRSFEPNAPASSGFIGDGRTMRDRQKPTVSNAAPVGNRLLLRSGALHTVHVRGSEIGRSCD